MFAMATAPGTSSRIAVTRVIDGGNGPSPWISRSSAMSRRCFLNARMNQAW